MTSIWRALLVASAIGTTGCTVTLDGQPIPAVPASSLPFAATITERVNSRNDGTSFEPCVAYTPSELEAVGIRPNSITDAAFSDSPNFRGCDWISPDGIERFSQIVGNESSLDSYKSKQSSRPWEPDRVASGRKVAVAKEAPDACIAVFMSADAVVITGVRTSTAREPSPGLKDECDKAIAFATLAASKAP